MIGEYRINEAERPIRNAKGRFISGCPSPTKGKKGFTSEDPDKKEKIISGLRKGWESAKGRKFAKGVKRKRVEVAFFVRGIPTVFTSTSDAARWIVSQKSSTSINAATGNIRRSIKTGRRCGGHRWYKVDSEEFNKIVQTRDM